MPRQTSRTSREDRDAAARVAAAPETPADASGPVRLPHWTEPPTGEVPTVVSGEQPAAPPDDELDRWKSASGQSPRYRVEDSDWAEGDFSPELLKDDSLALGALRDRDVPVDEDDDESFEAEVAARRRGATVAVGPDGARGPPGPSKARSPRPPFRGTARRPISSLAC